MPRAHPIATHWGTLGNCCTIEPHPSISGFQEARWTIFCFLEKILAGPWLVSFRVLLDQRQTWFLLPGMSHSKKTERSWPSFFNGHRMKVGFSWLLGQQDTKLSAIQQSSPRAWVDDFKISTCQAWGPSLSHWFFISLLLPYFYKDVHSMFPCSQCLELALSLIIMFAYVFHIPEPHFYQVFLWFWAPDRL